jgi:hypothetical protein
MPQIIRKFHSIGRPALLALLFVTIAAGWGALSTRHASSPTLRRVLAASTPGFTSDVQPILQKNCLPCHSADKHKGHLVIETYASLMAGGKHGNTVVPGNSTDSRMVAMLEGRVHPRMPDDKPPLPPDQIAIIKAWIDAGAKGPEAAQ